MKQETVTLNGRRIVMVEVPEGINTVGFGVYAMYGGVPYLVYDCIDNSYSDHRISLPPGDWQFLFADPLKPTEEECKGVVESGWWYDGPQEQHGLGKVTYYREYPNELEDSCLLSALDSWHSFVRSKGFEPGRVVALIKK